MAERRKPTKIDHPAGKGGMVVSRQHRDPTSFACKVALRTVLLPTPDGRAPRVLDAYAGDHDIWDCVKEIVGRPVEVLHVDTQPSHPTDLRIDNRRALLSLDLDRFDLVDLDAWGIPDEQTEILALRRYPGVVTWTCVLLNLGSASGRLLTAEGIPKDWLTNARALFSASSIRDRWLNYLAALGWKNALIASHLGHHYYGAVGHPGWDAKAYEDAYQRVLRSGVFARTTAHAAGL